MKPQMEAIIKRCEEVRTFLGLNKSRFSNAIGMKPQTYNNFIGSQASKPNMELIYGIVTRWKINALWLLTGEGTMMREGWLDPMSEVPDRNEQAPGVPFIPGAEHQKPKRLPLEETAVMVAAMISQGVDVRLRVSLDQDSVIQVLQRPTMVGVQNEPGMLHFTIGRRPVGP